MEQLRKILASLNLRQKISIVAAALAVAAALMYFANWRKEGDFKPLYTGLSSEDAGAVVQKLKESGLDYRLSESGGSVSVPSAKVAELRLEMASAGLPRSGRLGFEIFDKTNFGATEFVEHVNYRRALEGELERSVRSLSEVEQARVHLTFSKDSVFVEQQQPAKASVMVRLRTGRQLSPQNVQAVEYLVGSAVEGLTPEAVTVVDMRGQLLSRPKQGAEDPATNSEKMLQLREKAEKTLLAKVNATLEPLVGADRFRAGVTMEIDPTSGEQSEEIFDPARSVMMNSQKSEEVTGVGGTGGAPGTASNLPRPVARTSSSASAITRRTENINFQTSRSTKKVLVPQGVIRRVSVAVLLDQGLRWEGVGPNARRVLIPPTPETLKAVRDVVAGVAGVVTERGDTVVVESLPFESTLKQPPPPAPATPAAPARPAFDFGALTKDPKKMIIIAASVVGALLLAAVAAFFLMSRKKGKKSNVQMPAGQALPPGKETAPAEPEFDAAAELRARMDEQAKKQAALDAETLRSIKLPEVTSKKSEVIVKQLRETIKSDSTVSAAVLQSWIREREGN